MTDDPIARHRAEAPGVIASGDPAAIKRLYADLADYWEHAHGDDLESIPVLSRAETHPIVLALLGGGEGRFLDAGCGPRPVLSIAMGRWPGRQVVSMDMGIGTVRLARAVAADQGVPILGVVGDLEALPFRDHAFDGAVCDDTIEHVPDDARGVAELARVLAARGRMVLATPNRHSVLVLKQRVIDRLHRRRRPATDYFVSNSHLREYTWREFDALVRPVLAVQQRAGVGWDDAGWKRNLLNQGVSRWPFRHLGQMIVVAAERRSAP
jgi:SAM-dependent methyltransferase